MHMVTLVYTHISTMAAYSQPLKPTPKHIFTNHTCTLSPCANTYLQFL